MINYSFKYFVKISTTMNRVMSQKTKCGDSVSIKVIKTSRVWHYQWVLNSQIENHIEFGNLRSFKHRVNEVSHKNYNRKWHSQDFLMKWQEIIRKIFYNPKLKQEWYQNKLSCQHICLSKSNFQKSTLF